MERAVLLHLLQPEFPGKPELLKQANLAKVRSTCTCGCPSILLTLPPTTAQAKVLQRVPVEAESQDVDGVGIHFLLHVVDGMLREIEIFREDSEPIKKMPALETLSVSAFRPANN